MNFEDIAELKSLLHHATRENVKNFLTKTINDAERLISKPVVTSEPVQRPEYKSLTKYYWAQEDKEIVIYVDCEGIGKHSKDKIKVEFEPHSVTAIIDDLNGKNYKFAIVDLSKDINVEKSTYKTTSNRLVLKLRKKEDLDFWTKLRGRDKSDSGTKDFEKDIEDDPSKGLMNMLKRIYEEGDDETKRTVSKAWMEAQNKKELD